MLSIFLRITSLIPIQIEISITSKLKNTVPKEGDKQGLIKFQNVQFHTYTLLFCTLLYSFVLFFVLLYII